MITPKIDPRHEEILILLLVFTWRRVVLKDMGHNSILNSQSTHGLYLHPKKGLRHWDLRGLEINQHLVSSERRSVCEKLVGAKERRSAN